MLPREIEKSVRAVYPACAYMGVREREEESEGQGVGKEERESRAIRRQGEQMRLNGMFTVIDGVAKAPAHLCSRRACLLAADSHIPSGLLNMRLCEIIMS